jgi:diguanylate cyclase (GGDEF)-like protein
MTVTGIKDHHGTLTVLVSDVSERLEILRELEHLAHNDVLTGLPNRRSFRTSLSAAVDRGSQAAVLFIDLNGFKTVNDTHGHAAGDEVLTEVARRLVLALRDSDIVARLGGDEFAGLLYRCDIEQAQAAADRIVEAVAHPIATSAGVAEVTAAVGISFAEGASVSADAVLQSADTAMYRAKAAHQASIRAGLSPCRPVDVELTDAVGR